MTLEEVKSLPTTGIKIVNRIRRELDLIFEENRDFIKNNNDYFSFASIDNRFNFRINRIHFTNSPTLLTCTLSFNPRSSNNLKEIQHEIELEKVAERFSKWIDLVKENEEALKEYHDPYYKQFEKEFEDSFNLKDEKDNFETLDSENQLKIFKLITSIEDGLKKEDQNNPEVQKLISFVEEFKEKLPNLPKSVIKKKAIELISRLRKLGTKLYYDVLEVGYKEIIKAALIVGATEAGKAVVHLLK